MICVKFELIECVERAHPVLRITVVHERHPVDQRVSGRHNLFLRQVDEYVAVSVAAAQQQDLDFAVAHVQRDRLVEGPGRQPRFHPPQFFQIGLGLSQVGFQPRFLRRVGGRRKVVAQFFDFLRHQFQLLFDVRNAA